MAKRENANKVMNQFIKDELKGVVNRINEKMKNDGFMYLKSGEDFFYHPSEGSLCDHDTGKDYAKNQSYRKIGIVDLEEYLECLVNGYTMDFFTDKDRHDEFVKKVFANIKSKSKASKLKERKSQLNTKIKSLQSQIDDFTEMIADIDEEVGGLDDDEE